jgi:hypothetical protein
MLSRQITWSQLVPYRRVHVDAHRPYAPPTDPFHERLNVCPVETDVIRVLVVRTDFPTYCR